MVAFLYTEGISKQLLIPVVDVLTSPRKKCNLYGATNFIPRESILTSLVLVHAGYLFWHSLNTNYYGTTLGGMPGSFNSSQINACVLGIGVLGPRFIVSSEGLGLHKMLPLRGFEPGTSRMPGKRCTTMLPLGLRGTHICRAVGTMNYQRIMLLLGLLFKLSTCNTILLACIS